MAVTFNGKLMPPSDEAAAWSLVAAGAADTVTIAVVAAKVLVDVGGRESISSGFAVLSGFGVKYIAEGRGPSEGSPITLV